MWWTGPGTVVDAFLWRNRLLMKVNDFIPDPGCQLNFILWFREGRPQSSTPPSSKSLDIYQTKPIYWLKDHCLGSKVIPRIDRWIDLMMFEAFGLFLISILGFWTLHYSQICWNAGAQNDTKCTCAFCFLHTQLYPEKAPKKPWNTHTHTHNVCHTFAPWGFYFKGRMEGQSRCQKSSSLPTCVHLEYCLRGEDIWMEILWLKNQPQSIRSFF